jgi:hypothetical protein
MSTNLLIIVQPLKKQKHISDYAEINTVIMQKQKEAVKMQNRRHAEIASYIAGK